MDGSAGAMGALKNIEKPLLFEAFPALGVPGGSMGGHWWSLEGPWGDPWGFLGVPWASLGGSDASLECP